MKRRSMWHGFWFIVRKADRVVVGSADFKDAPNERGEVEIGYGLGREFEGNGSMMAAVRAMCAWAKGQPGVRRILLRNGAGRARLPARADAVRVREETCGETIGWSL